MSDIEAHIANLVALGMSRAAAAKAVAEHDAVQAARGPSGPTNVPTPTTPKPAPTGERKCKMCGIVPKLVAPNFLYHDVEMVEADLCYPCYQKARRGGY